MDEKRSKELNLIRRYLRSLKVVPVEYAEDVHQEYMIFQFENPGKCKNLRLFTIDYLRVAFGSTNNNRIEKKTKAGFHYNSSSIDEVFDVSQGPTTNRVEAAIDLERLMECLIFKESIVMKLRLAGHIFKEIGSYLSENEAMAVYRYNSAKKKMREAECAF